MRLQPVLHALTEQAAQGEILHNDDTSMTVLELLGRAGPRGDPPVDEVSPDRTGVFTSAVVSMGQGRRIALSDGTSQWTRLWGRSLRSPSGLPPPPAPRPSSHFLVGESSIKPSPPLP
jgi:hypothetical protein